MEKQTISCPAACFVVSYGYTKDARFWYDFRMRGTHKEDKIVAQAITDYVKFLADARDAVYRVNCDSRTAQQLSAEESRREKELASVKKEVADTFPGRSGHGGMRSIPAMTEKSPGAGET